MTVKNERAHLQAWFQSIQKQTVQPDEIVIVDGGSTDGTLELLEEHTKQMTGLRVYKKAGNISTGRNEAIRQAKGEILVVTDAGCTHDPSWIEKLIAPLKQGTIFFTTTAFGPWFDRDDSLLIYAIAASTTPAPRSLRRIGFRRAECGF